MGQLTTLAQLKWMGPNQGKETAMPATTAKKDILSRLGQGEVIVGDGSYVVTLEKRGYVKAGDWTPEASVEDEDAPKLSCKQINSAACKIAKEVSDEYGTIVCGGITQTETYVTTKNKEKVQEELTKALEVLIENDVDMILVEYFFYIQEMEWAIELCRKYNKPIAATMAIGPKGDRSGISAGECAVRMAKAGADIVGANCLFVPWIGLETLKKMKVALDAFNMSPHLMTQPNAYRCPDCGPFGWLSLPEFPYAIEPRQITRFEVRQWARQAYDLGVRYIGGCCGFEPYLIRAIAEELREVGRGE